MLTTSHFIQKMGKKKKKFIDKKKAVSFHLVQRVGETVEGQSQFVLQPDSRTDESKIPADFPVDLLQSNEEIEFNDTGPSFPFGLFEEQGPRVAEDYDYSQHLKPISGTGVFIGAVSHGHTSNDVIGYLDESNPRFAEPVKEEDDEIVVDPEAVMPLPEQGNFRLTKDFLQAMDSDNEDFEELDDDFVLQAMQSDDGQEGDEGDEGEDGDEEYGEEETKDDGTSSRQARDIDKEFDRLYEEYDDDDVGDLGQYYEDDPQGMTGPLGVDTHQDYLDDFAQRKDRNYKLGVDNADLDDDEIDEVTDQMGSVTLFKPKRAPVTSITDLRDQQKAIQKHVEKLDDEDLESVHKEILAMKNPIERNKWDCESIVSTYSNLENHPAIIKAPRKNGAKKIQLSKKTGIPIGYFPTKETKEVTKEVIEEEEEGDEGETANDLGAARPKEETKEEKKARKAAVKAARRDNRNRKKELKDTYKAESIRQTRNDVNQKTKNPAGMRLE